MIVLVEWYCMYWFYIQQIIRYIVQKEDPQPNILSSLTPILAMSGFQGL